MSLEWWQLWKTAKNCILLGMVPFLISYHIWYSHRHPISGLIYGVWLRPEFSPSPLVSLNRCCNGLWSERMQKWWPKKILVDLWRLGLLCFSLTPIAIDYWEPNVLATMKQLSSVVHNRLQNTQPLNTQRKHSMQFKILVGNCYMHALLVSGATCPFLISYHIWFSHRRPIWGLI